MLLTTNEIKELCSKFGLIYEIKDGVSAPNMYVYFNSPVLTPGKTALYMFLTGVRTCYRLKNIYPELNHVFHNNAVNLTLTGIFHTDIKKPHTFNELVRITDDVHKQIIEKEKQKKFVMMMEKKYRLEADFDC